MKVGTILSNGDERRRRSLERLVREQGAVKVAKLLAEAIPRVEVGPRAMSIVGALRDGVREAERG